MSLDTVEPSRRSKTLLGLLVVAPWLAACSSEASAPGVNPTGGTVTGTTGSDAATTTTSPGSTSTSGMDGATSVGGSGTTTAGADGTTGVGGGATTTDGMGGATSTASTTDVGSGGTLGGFGGSGGTGTTDFELDCGPNAHVVESAGPPANRVNYVIVGDGYTESEIDTTYVEHLDFAMAKRFSAPIGEPYLRYRRFVNICAVKLVSNGGICGNSALDCCGDDQSRLANCNRNAALAAIEDNIPANIEVDWTAVVLNGSSWWNTGSSLMLWSGGNQDADGAALHEGGHGFHQLADEYGSCGSNQVNVTSGNQDSGGKWDIWLGYDQQPGTGVQDFFACDGGSNYRPTDNSMMNSLFGEDPDTSHNSVSREKMVMDFWRFVEPVDSVDPPEGSVMNPTTLTLNVIDPAVVSVDWSVDGSMVAADAGPSFNVASSGLASGSYTVTARAYDNADEDLVRYRDGGDYGRDNWARSEQTVTWTITIP